MKPRLNRFQHVALSLASIITLSATAQAQWNGSGVSAGTGDTVLTDSANWTGGLFTGDFSTVDTPGAYNFTLANDQALTSTLNFTSTTLTNNTAFSIVGGTGYAASSTTIPVTVSGDGTGMTATATSNGSGVITGVTITNQGTGYTSNPTFAIGGAGTGATATVTGSFPLAQNYNLSSSSGGAPRILTLGGSITLPSRSYSSLTTTSDVAINLGSGSRTISGSSTGVIGSLSTATFNGGIDLNGFTLQNGANTGGVTINGVVSNGAINFGTANGANALTLTNSANSFAGGITSGGFGSLVANSTTVLANTGINSALGAGGTIQLNNNSLTLTGFATTQTSNRSWNTGNGNAKLFNNGTANLVLTGTMTNSVSPGKLKLDGTYSSRSVPNQITGLATNGTQTLGFEVLQGIWLISNDNNSYTNGVAVGAGAVNGQTLRFTSVGDTGVNSALGSAGTIGMGGAGADGRTNYLEYVGSTNSSTNRALAFGGGVNGGGSNSVVANGAGSLTFTGTVSGATLGANGSGNSRTIYLEGIGNGAFSSTSSASLGNITSGSNTISVAITKLGSGTWTMAGSNFNHTNTTRINAGTLNLDYTTNSQLTADRGILLDAGTLIFKAAAAGTTDTVSSLQISSSQYTSTKTVLDGSAGTFGLTATVLQGVASNSNNTHLLDLSSNAGNSITVTGLGTNLKSVNSVLQNNAATASNGRASLIVKDSTGYGFATLSGDTTGTLQKLASFTTLDATTSGANTNYQLNTAGLLTRTAELDFNTITVDSTAGAITLAMESYLLKPTAGGRGILVSGSNDVTFTGSAPTALAGGNSVFLHNYLGSAATLTLGTSLGGGTLVLAGDGFTTYSGSGFGSSINVYDGLLRATFAQNISTSTAQLRFGSGAVFEIGADLNSATAGDFTNALGHATNGRIAFYYNSGLSASGADRIVNFGGASAGIAWGSGAFLTDSGGSNDGGFTLKLSSAKSDATIEIQNPIDLNSSRLHGRSRTIDVADGSAAVDAKLSGALSGVSSSLIKTGAGTLELSATNTYGGDTTVVSGVLRITTVCLSDTATVSLSGSSALVLPNAGTDIVGALVIGGVPQADGLYTFGTGKLQVGAAVLTPYQIWAAAYAPAADVSDPAGDNDNDGLKNQQEFAYGLNPTSGSSVNPITTQLDKTTGLFSYQRLLASGLTYTYEYSTTLVGAWTPFTPDSASTNSGDPVEIITVDLPNVLLTNPKLFIRVNAQ